MAASNVPNSWDEEDWEKLANKPPPPILASRRPNPTAPPFNPPAAPRLLRASAPEFDSSHLLYTPLAGGVPKTLHKPELKILKRTPEVPGAPPPAAPNPSEGTEKERREREHKERERRYKEVRERIMGNTEEPETKSKKTKNGKRSPDTPRSRTPKPASPAPSHRSSPPSSITSLSLNGGGFTAPTRFAKDLDGKLLESQVLRVRGSQEAPPTTATQAGTTGLDWDSFSRNEGWSWGHDANTAGAYYPVDYGRGLPQQQSPSIYDAAAAAADFPTIAALGYSMYARPHVERPGKQPGGAQGVVQAVRAPRGPDADGGRGFNGRGIRGMRIREGV